MKSHIHLSMQLCRKFNHKLLKFGTCTQLLPDYLLKFKVIECYSLIGTYSEERSISQKLLWLWTNCELILDEIR